LGARKVDILHYFQLENLLIAGSGAVIGIVMAIGLNLWLMRLYQMDRLPVVYTLIGVAAVLVLGQCAVFVPARRASNVPPVTATRSAGLVEPAPPVAPGEGAGWGGAFAFSLGEERPLTPTLSPNKVGGEGVCKLRRVWNVCLLPRPRPAQPQAQPRAHRADGAGHCGGHRCVHDHADGGASVVRRSAARQEQHAVFPAGGSGESHRGGKHRAASGDGLPFGHGPVERAS